MFVIKWERKARVMSDLESFLVLNGSEPAKFLAREVQTWGEFSYEELEAAILEGHLDELIDWQARYAAAINEVLAPQWSAAIEAAAKKSSRGKIILSDSEEWVKAWLTAHGAELVTRLSDESKKAITNVLLKWQAEKLNPRVMAQQIRPLIGLNERQAIANANYRAKLYRKLTDNGVNPGQAAQRADKAAARYASKQHRYRAETIVHTELAFAYNQGAHEGIMRSIAGKYMNRCAMVWSTAGVIRTCGRCLELNGKVVGYTDESGVTLPPLHPRCRCAIMYREAKIQGENQSLNTGSSRGTGGSFALPSYPKDFTPAKTIAEANAFAMNVLKIPRAEYKGCAVEVANEWNYGLSKSFKRFPKLKENFSFVGEAYEQNALCEAALTDYYYSVLEEGLPDCDKKLLHQQAQLKASRDILETMKISAGTCARALISKQPGKRDFNGVAINRDIGRDYRHFLEIQKYNEATRNRPVGCGTIKSVLDHEIGHQLDKMLGLRDMPEIQALFESRVKTINGAEDYSRITEELSRYAWKNDNPNRYAEFIAEAWAEYCNNPSPREIAQSVGAIVEREYAKRFGRQAT